MEPQTFRRYRLLLRQALEDSTLHLSDRMILFRDAAALALPLRCRGQACETDPRACSHRHPALSYRDRKDCISRLEADSNAWKLAAKLAGRLPGVERFRAALPSALKAEAAAAAAAALEPKPFRVQHWRYLAYWRSLIAAQFALHSGDFPNARLAFHETLQHANNLRPKTCAPFFGPRELAAHTFLVDAVAAVKDGRFALAAESFESWLAHFPQRRGTHDLWFDSVIANHLACLVLNSLLTGAPDMDALATLDRHLHATNVFLPTWALCRRVHSLAAAARIVRLSLSSLLGTDHSLWTLFLTYTDLDDEDRISGQARPFAPPRFLDTNTLTSDHPNWEQILVQNLRNAAYLLADYERFRHDTPAEEEKDLIQVSDALSIADDLPTERLLHIVRTYLERRDRRLLQLCDHAVGLLPEFASAVQASRFADAMEVRERILKCFHFPHVVIADHSVAQPSDSDSLRPTPRYDVTFRRLWNREPRSMRFPTITKLDQGSYYYLRPTWNTRLDQRYPLNKDERFGSAAGIQWIDTLWSGLFTPKKVDAATFSSWILQFEPAERRFASILFGALDVYDEERVRRAWIDAFLKLPPHVKSDVAFIGLGHTAKSSHQQIYYFRQAIASLPEYQLLYSGREKNVFRHLAEFKSGIRGLRRPSTFVFVDDFIGTGGQASDFVNWYFRDEDFDFLEDSAVFLMVLTGFDDGLKTVGTVLRARAGGRSTDVIAGRVLTDTDRAFSASNAIWRDAEESRRAQAWATTLGQELLSSDPTLDAHGQRLYEPERDALGWHNCQALISFHHNIPSDTLPIFWSRGWRRGAPWLPLQRRND